MALQRKENERLQLLSRPRSAPGSPAPSSSRDEDYLGFHSDSGERPTPDNPASIRLNVYNPFANAFKVFGHIGNTISEGAAPESTNALSTAGLSGSQSSQTWVFPQDLSDAAALSPAVPPEQLGHTQTIMEQPTMVLNQQTTPTRKTKFLYQRSSLRLSTIPTALTSHRKRVARPSHQEDLVEW